MKKTIKTTFTLALILVLCTKHLHASEVELDVYGDNTSYDDISNNNEEQEHDESSEEVDDVEEMDVYLYNKFDEELHVYYEPSSGLEPSFMGSIDPLGTLEFTTFPGHQFYATLGEAGDEVEATVHIREGVVYYSLVSTILGDVELSTTIRTFPHADVKYIDEESTSAAARFRSLSSRELDLWDGDFDEPLETIREGEDTTYNTYEGYVYSYTPHGEPDNILGNFTISNDQVLYLMYDEEFPASEEVLNRAEKEVNYIYAHRNETGLLWRSYFGDEGPRGPPALYMWPANAIGEVHEVSSRHGYWNCDGSPQDCQSDEDLTLELEVISQEPRAFIIHNFLSEYEADKIIELGEPNLENSLIGQGDAAEVSNSRSSKNTWIARDSSIELETITLRAADLLQIDQSLLITSANAEDLQVIHYDIGEKYAPHHDWAVGDGSSSRYITLLFYLTDMASPDAGGETAFPKAAGGRGVKVHPGKGSAVLFYNLLEDGNSDDLSLHESIPVNEGEKWLANYWIWDPERAE